MAQQPEPPEAPPLPPLKVIEREPAPDDPWGDDALDRKESADFLTEIVRGQDEPFVISVDGRWGTGKTFLLKRWRQDLENQEWQAIYFNAWEDDFSDNPLLAIIGQLSEHFDDGALQAIVHGVANAALSILTKHLTGTAIKLDDLEADTLLKDYGKQQETKRKVQEELGRLAAEVREETGQPLVFIIDELDRCRPTFAIELLERVKHIFDVPNIVFVFGINRAELVKSLESVYGEIDAGIYLRRFFDIEFVLPDADPEKFCRHLIHKFRLHTFVSGLSQEEGRDHHVQELNDLISFLPVILGNLGFSLRDMDYSIRLLALVGRDLPRRQTVYPEVLTSLVALKVGNPDLYRRFVERDARGAEVIDYLSSKNPVIDYDISQELRQKKSRMIEVYSAVYCADSHYIVLDQLNRLRNHQKLTQPQYLATETASLNPEIEADTTLLDRTIELVGWYARYRTNYSDSLRSLSQKIDLYSGMMRR